MGLFGLTTEEWNTTLGIGKVGAGFALTNPFTAGLAIGGLALGQGLLNNKANNRQINKLDKRIDEIQDREVQLKADTARENRNLFSQAQMMSMSGDSQGARGIYNAGIQEQGRRLSAGTSALNNMEAQLKTARASMSKRDFWDAAVGAGVEGVTAAVGTHLQGKMMEALKGTDNAASLANPGKANIPSPEAGKTSFNDAFKDGVKNMWKKPSVSTTETAFLDDNTLGWLSDGNIGNQHENPFNSLLG